MDVYTGARFAWLSSHLQRQGYVDEAMSEFGWSDEGGIVHSRVTMPISAKQKDGWSATQELQSKYNV